MLTSSDPRGAGNTNWKVPSGRQDLIFGHSGRPVRVLGFHRSFPLSCPRPRRHHHSLGHYSATGNESLQVGAWFGADIWLEQRIGRTPGFQAANRSGSPKMPERSDNNSYPPSTKYAQHQQALMSAPHSHLALALAMSQSQASEQENLLSWGTGMAAGNRWYRAGETEASHSRGRDGRCTRHHLQRASQTSSSSF